MSITQARILFALVIAGIAFALYLSCNFLPDHVAANFGKGGKVVTFNSRETYRFLMTLFALLLPAMIYIAMAWLLRVTARFTPIPNRNYWLSSEHRSSTLLWIEKFGLATGALVSVFWFALHMVNFHATILEPPHYELWPRLSLLAGWLVFVVGSGIVYRRHFNRRK